MLRTNSLYRDTTPETAVQTGKALVECDAIQLLEGNPEIGKPCLIALVNPVTRTPRRTALPQNRNAGTTRRVKALTSRVVAWQWGYPDGNRIVIETMNTVYVGEKA